MGFGRKGAEGDPQCSAGSVWGVSAGQARHSRRECRVSLGQSSGHADLVQG